MLRRACRWLHNNPALAALCGCTAFSAAGWVANIVWPASIYGYLHEQALLVVIGLGALWRFRESPTAAVTLYFAGALLPVGAMIEYCAPTLTPLIAIPPVGVFVVAVLTRHIWGTLAYTGAAILTSLIIGAVYGDAGGGVALAFITAVLGGAKAYKCNKEQDALNRLGIIERGLSRYVGGENK